MRFFLLTILLCACTQAAAAAETVRVSRSRLLFSEFEPLGFSTHSPVHSLHVDSQGRVWVGTELKLAMYDGSELHTYAHEPADPRSLSYPLVRAIDESPDGTIWIGTWGGGLNRYDAALDSVVPVPLPEPHTTDFDGKVWSMVVDHDGKVWIGSFTQGLFVFDPATGAYERILYYPSDEDRRSNRVQHLSLGPDGDVWAVMSGKEVVRIDAHSHRLLERIGAQQLPDVVRGVAALPFAANETYLLTRHALYRILDAKAETVFAIEAGEQETEFRAMARLRDGTFVIGSGAGVWEIPPGSHSGYFTARGVHYPYPRGDVFWSVVTDAQDNIFIGTSGGVFVAHPPNPALNILGVLDDRAGAFTNSRIAYRLGDELLVSFEDRLFSMPDDVLSSSAPVTAKRLSLPATAHIMAIAAVDATLYVGGEDGMFRRRDAALDDWQNVAHHSVSGLLPDMGRIWVGSYGKGIGWLDVAGDAKQVAWADDTDPDAPRSLRVSRMHKDRYEKLWFGTYSGLGRFDPATLEYVPISPDATIARKLASAHLNCFVDIGPDRILICGDGGFYIAQIGEDGIQELESHDDLPFLSSAPIAGAREREDGNILLFTEDRGAAVISPEGELLSTMSLDAGFPAHSIWMGAVRDLGDGWTGLGAVQSPLLIRHDAPLAAPPLPALRFSAVTTFRPEGRASWPAEDNETRFEYMDNFLRFNFGLLDYFSPDNNRYRFRLTGLSEEWIDLGSRRETTFTSLPPGDYRLDVEAVNGLDPQITTISKSFVVLPPWWRTWWAYALYAFVIIGISTAYVLSLQRKIAREREISQRLREADRIKSHFLNELEEKVELATQDLRHAVEALEIKNVELDAAQHRALDASRLKSEFLANMSHEIRTPMNGILGFTQLLAKSRLDNDQRDYLDTIDKSATSLLGIINDVLDVSKIEAGKLVIDNTGFSLRQCVSDTLEALTPIAYEKDLDLVGHVDESLPEGLRGDPVRLRQMITNLVGNAVKFTDRGHVIVHVTRHADTATHDWLRISVIDTGRGITPEDRDRLFQAFERGSVNLAGRFTGTGLGLVITKKLCEAMGGHIELDSEPGAGTRMTLELPLVADRNPESRYGFGKPLLGKHLLLIDPDAHSRDALRSRFLHWGAEVQAVATVDAASETAADIAVIGIGRLQLDDINALQTTCDQLPEGLPRLCLAATVDRETLRALGDACCGADCVPKVGYKEGQLRRMRSLLGLPPLHDTSAAPATQPLLQGLHIVVADDNRINRYFLRKILEVHHARITEAADGASALQALNTTALDADIVLLDVHMPDMDGLEVARRIRASGRKRLPLLAVSANVQPETYEAAVQAGINDYLLKPVDENKLVEAILEWTGREETA